YIIDGSEQGHITFTVEEISRQLESGGTSVRHFKWGATDTNSLSFHILSFLSAPDTLQRPLSFLASSIAMIAAHIEYAKSTVIPVLENGINVILEGYVWSHLAGYYQSHAHHDILATIIKLESFAWPRSINKSLFLLTPAVPMKGQSSAQLTKELAFYEELASIGRDEYRISMLQVNHHSIDAFPSVHMHETDDSESKTITCHCDSDIRNNYPNSSELPLQLHFKFPFSSQLNKSGPHSPTVFSHLAPAKLTKVYESYWRFAAERQAIFFRKYQNESPPWTQDPILAKHKFTNAYRASDRVSQFLIRHIAYETDNSPNEVFFRIILFKMFNRIETWELLVKELGVIRYADFDYDKYDRLLTKSRRAGHPIYSGAYIMPSGSSTYGYAEKHRNNLKLLEKMMDDGLPQMIAEAKSMQNVFELLRSYPMIGDFLAYQYAIDLNYSELTNFSEMDFVIPGPGARDGIRKCFSDLGGLNEIDVIRLMADRQHEEFERLDLKFEFLWGRPLQLIDCQNLFCEVDKYSRLAHPEIEGRSGRTRIKQIYHAKQERIEFRYPPKWGLNEKIKHAT
ncbi:MAG: nucleotide kinase domain-containing protein, partial [Syntrophobacteraceae bacterium]